MVVSAKFGGEFKIMHTMRKTKKSNIESFAEQCTQDSLKMFSRSWSASVNLFLASSQTKGSESKTESKKEETKKQNETNNM